MKNTRKFLKILIPLTPFLYLFFIFRNLFLPTSLSSGDFIYYFSSSIKTITPFVLWDSRHQGMGASNLPTLWIEGPFTLHIQIAKLIPWILYERLFWFWPFLFFTFFSSFFLARKILGKSIFAYLAPIIYTTNTYVLLLVGGGQMGGAIAYGIAPVVIILFLRILESKQNNIKSSVGAGLIFALMMTFDIRPSYILAILLIVQYVAVKVYSKEKLFDAKKLLHYFGIPAVIIVCIHLYWLLPLIVLRSNPIEMVGSEITSISSVKFLSFAKMEDVISLLHPNWPENIFGKTSFLAAQYLILPIMAFLGAFYIKLKSKQQYGYIYFLIAIALFGIFIGKGANEPFGELYLWFFEYIPGFKMFRDPTKWYILVALSYSILIPFFLKNFSEMKIFKKKAYVESLLFVLFIIVWTLLIKDVIFYGRGTYVNHPLPSEYKQFAKFLENDNRFSRTLWIPSTHRYGYFSEGHPALNFYEITKKLDARAYFAKVNRYSELQKRSIGYVVVPIDSDHEIFLKDRVYSLSVHNSYLKALENQPYLKRLNQFKNLAVYVVENPNPLFFVNGNGRVSSSTISSTKYLISTQGINLNSRIIFGQNFDSNWELRIKGKTYKSSNFEGLNSFLLDFRGDAGGTIEYGPQKWVLYGLIGTVATLIVSIYILIKK